MTELWPRKEEEMPENQPFFRKRIKIINFFGIYLLIMPNYWGKQIFRHGSFPEMGQKQKTERKRKKGRRVKVGNNNGRLRIATLPRVVKGMV